MHEDGPKNNCPHSPLQSLDTDETENEMKEIMKVPETTPVTINTTSGRELIIKYSDDCYIAATLTSRDDTTSVAAQLTSMLMMIANMRFGGLEEAQGRWDKLLKNMEVRGG